MNSKPIMYANVTLKSIADDIDWNSFYPKPDRDLECKTVELIINDHNSKSFILACLSIPFYSIIVIAIMYKIMSCCIKNTERMLWPLAKLSTTDTPNLIVYHEVVLAFFTVWLFSLGLMAWPHLKICPNECLRECSSLDMSVYHSIPVTQRSCFVNGILFGGAIGALVGSLRLCHIRVYEQNSIKWTGADLWLNIFLIAFVFYLLGWIFAIVLILRMHYYHKTLKAIAARTTTSDATTPVEIVVTGTPL